MQITVFCFVIVGVVWMFFGGFLIVGCCLFCFFCFFVVLLLLFVLFVFVFVVCVVVVFLVGWVL